MKPLLALLLLVLALPGVAFAHSVALTCSDSDPSVVSYHFYRATVSGGPYAQIDTSTITSCAFTDTLITLGATYYYVVKAVNSSGDQSAYSNESKAVIPQAPQAPTGLQNTVS
jgi:fibronectin type 3 domain-containing protein